MNRANAPLNPLAPPIIAGVITERSASAPTSAVITYTATSRDTHNSVLLKVENAVSIGRQFLPATNVQYTPANIGDPCLLIASNNIRLLWAFTERVETEACAESA